MLELASAAASGMAGSERRQRASSRCDALHQMAVRDIHWTTRTLPAPPPDHRQSSLSTLSSPLYNQLYNWLYNWLYKTF